jgi:hypothetical protein
MDVRVWTAAATLLAFGLAGCASNSSPSSDRPGTDATPYVGTFTGQFIDGKPLYRLPTIEVVGSRSGSIQQDTFR